MIIIIIIIINSHQNTINIVICGIISFYPVLYCTQRRYCGCEILKVKKSIILLSTTAVSTLKKIRKLINDDSRITVEYSAVDVSSECKRRQQQKLDCMDSGVSDTVCIFPSTPLMQHCSLCTSLSRFCDQLGNSTSSELWRYGGWFWYWPVSRLGNIAFRS